MDQIEVSVACITLGKVVEDVVAITNQRIGSGLWIHIQDEALVFHLDQNIVSVALDNVDRTTHVVWFLPVIEGKGGYVWVLYRMQNDEKIGVEKVDKAEVLRGFKPTSVEHQGI